MNILKQFIVISIISFFLFFFILEIFLIKNIQYLFPLNSYLPNTSLTKEIRNTINIYDLKNRKKITLNNKDYSVYNKSIEKETSSKDIKYGATKNWHYNNQGFCNMHDDKKAEIISFGDSFTYCTAVRPTETYIYNIFNKIDEKKIYNYGMTGTGPNDYTNALIEKINKQTKLVIYSIYEGNDFISMIEKNEINKNLYNEKNISINSKNFIYNFAINNFGKFYSFHYIYAVLKRIIFPIEHNLNFKYSKIYNDKEIKLNIGNSDIDEIHSALFLIENKKRHIYLDKLLKKLEKNMVESEKYSKKFNLNIIFVYIPSAYSSLKRTNLKFEDEKIGELVLKYSKVFSENFENICEIYKFNCLNTIKSLQEYNNQTDKLTHFPHNVHLTANGHAIIGNSIKSYICTNRINYFRSYCD
tara:strand:- start:538 stop:1779 length:1242 start_codon:yes stop_codon:yes gene_type:complete